MTKTHVLRIPRTDEEQSFVLVEVTSAGSKDLDLKLVATEGFAPYVVKCACLRCRASFPKLPAPVPLPVQVQGDPKPSASLCLSSLAGLVHELLVYTP